MTLSDMLKKGESMAHAGALADAKNIYLSILAEAPNNAEALNNLGVIEFVQGNNEAANNYLEAALKHDPDYLDAGINLCNLFMQTGQYQKSANILKIFSMRYPNDERLRQIAQELASLRSRHAKQNLMKEVDVVSFGVRQSNVPLPKLPEHWIGPVVIGGVGGSGTRLLARLIEMLGFYTGTHLNQSDDNMFFAQVFSNPFRFIWGDTERETAYQIMEAIKIFEMSMLYPQVLTCQDIRSIIRYAMEYGNRTQYLDVKREGFRAFVSNVFLSMIMPKNIEYEHYIGWGWKEPCTFIYLKHLFEYFPKMKYIHVMRHGLDMAYSDNTFHLESWGWKFGIPEDLIQPQRMLKFWCNANMATVGFGTQHLGPSKLLLIKFEDVCYHPQKTAEVVAEFLGLQISQPIVNEFCNMIKIPETIGRYKHHSTSMLEQSELNIVAEFGYEIN